MEQEKKRQSVRTVLLIVLWLIVLALAGGRSLAYLSELHREEQLALLGRMAPLFEGQEEELVKEILQEDSETDAENGRKLLENSGFYRRGYRELGQTESLKFLFCGWCMLAALGVLLLLSSARKKVRRYREIENLGESMFLWKTQIPRAWEPETEYFRDCLVRCQEQMEKQQAAQKEDMQRQTRYLENLVHQMKTPLAGISLCHDYLEEMETDPGKQDLLTKSRMQINHLETLVRQLLLLARLEDGRIHMKLAHVVMEDIMGKVQQVTGPLSREKHQTVSWDYAVEREVFCDCFWIQEVLINIIKNAIEHTPEHGTIEIWTEDADAGVNLFVRDNGPGIPEADLQQIFRRFYSDVSVENGRSTGIGLNLAYEIVMKHGGRLEALKYEDGAWFCLHLYDG